MSRINSNIPSLIARTNLSRSNSDLELRLERLSTGLRINRGSDDPAGLIISERIRAEIEGINQGIRNTERASSVLATTEAALAEINDLLSTIQALVVEAANTGANSPAERDANQLQIDSAIDSITRIANTASFGGKRLLDGSQDYNLSGVDGAAISRAEIISAQFDASGPVQVDVEVVASAQTGALYVNGNINPTAGEITSSLTLEIAGPLGVTTLNFTSGQSLAEVVNAVNDLTGVTGVDARLINDNASSGLVFESEAYGSNAFVSVRRLDRPADSAADNWATLRLRDGAEAPDGTPFPFGNGDFIAGSRDSGQDVAALVNGNLASGDGLVVSLSTTVLSTELDLNESFGTTPGGTTRFDILGGGAIYQIGPDINPNQQINIGVRSVAASSLGGTVVDGKAAFLSSVKKGQPNSIESSFQRNDFSAISTIIDQAIDEVSVLRGRLGAFERNVLDTTQRSLQASSENLSASNSLIRDADFALETSALTRAQILSSSGTTVLGLANQQSQQVLQLLG